MRHWHKCRRWWRVGIACPYSSLVEHEEQDDDEGEPDERKPVLGPPAKRPKEAMDAKKQADRPGANITDKELEDLGKAEKIRKEAEEVVRNVPKPIPRIVEPVGDLDSLLPPPKGRRTPPPLPERGRGLEPSRPRAATNRKPFRVPGAEEEVSGKKGTVLPRPVRVPDAERLIGLAGAIVTNRVLRGVPDGASLAPATVRALATGRRPPPQVFDPTLPPPPPASMQVKAAAAEEAVTQEFAKAPAPQGHGFGMRQIGFIVGGTAATAALIIASGGGGGGSMRFQFNAASRLRGLLTTGARP